MAVFPKKHCDNQDAEQIIKETYDQEKVAQRVIGYSPLVPEDYDEISIAYTTVLGEQCPEFFTYKKDNVVCAVIQVAYNANGDMSNVKRI